MSQINHPLQGGIVVVNVAFVGSIKKPRRFEIGSLHPRSYISKAPGSNCSLAY